MDPLSNSFPWYTPYQFAGNTPIQAVDLDGEEEKHYTLTMNEGKPVFTLTKEVNRDTWFFGFFSYTPARKDIVTYNNGSQDRTYQFTADGANYTIGMFNPKGGLDDLQAWKQNSTTPFDQVFTSDFELGLLRVQQLLNYAVNAKMTLGGIKGINNLRPPLIKAQINSRHYLSSNAIAKAGKTPAVTLAPKATLDADLASYNAGNFSKGKDGNVIVNGNTYGLKNEGTTLYPIIGKGFTSLTAGQIQAIQFYKTKSGSDLTKALEGAAVSQADKTFAEDFIKKY